MIPAPSYGPLLQAGCKHCFSTIFAILANDAAAHGLNDHYWPNPDMAITQRALSRCGPAWPPIRADFEPNS
jgi:hypothetical protein